MHSSVLSSEVQGTAIRMEPSKRARPLTVVLLLVLGCKPDKYRIIL